MNRAEVRNNKSKFRSALKKCKDALTRQHPATDDKSVPDNALNTKWYLNSDDNEESRNEATNSLLAEGYCGLSTLVDAYLGDLYPFYIEHHRDLVIRQARDVLVCEYHGDLQLFETKFLQPASEIIKKIKKRYNQNSSTLLWQKGWPLTIGSRALVLHLGSIDESTVRASDFYFCIKPSTINAPVQLCVCWRCPKTINFNIKEKILDPERDSLSPLSIEMLAEDLTQLLQTVLVGVERAITRVPLDNLTFPDEILDFNEIVDPTNDWTTINEEILIDPNKEITFDTSDSTNRHSCFIISGNECCHDNSDKIVPTIKEDSLSDDIQTEDIEAKPLMPFSCLGISFPHIDSDEDSGDDGRKSDSEFMMSHNIVAQKRIADVPEKLLLSGVYLPGTFLKNGLPLIVIEINESLKPINCYELATIILYYSSIPLASNVFSVHLIVYEESFNRLNSILSKLDECIKLLYGHVKFDIVLATSKNMNRSKNGSKLSELANEKYKEKLPLSQTKIEFINSIDQMSGHVDMNDLFNANECYHQNQLKWIEFFQHLEPFQNQCLKIGRQLVFAMNEVRKSNEERNLQHCTLSRLLMDSELQAFRYKGPNIIAKLQNIYKSIYDLRLSQNFKIVAKTKNIENSNNVLPQFASKIKDDDSQITAHNKILTDKKFKYESRNENILEQRLNEVKTMFQEVDNAVKRIEQIIEHRKEWLKELTRQRTLQEEIQEVLNWLQADGGKLLKIYNEKSFECGERMKDQEQEFEKFYFISKKCIARGKDLMLAAKDFDSLLQINNALNQEIVTFSGKLEENREKVETSAQFHQLLSQNLNDEESKKELARLAEKLRIPDYIEKYEACYQAKSKPKYTATITMISTLIPKSEICDNRNPTMIKTNTPTTLELRSPTSNMLPPLIEEKNEKFSEFNMQDQCNQEGDDILNDDNDDTSKLCDSGVCDQFCTDEDTTISQDMTCTYSCQSIYDATTNTFENSHMDNLEDDDLDSSVINDTSLKSENTKTKNDIIDNTIPLQTNAHLYCHTSNLQLDIDDSTLDQKTQKTLLLIIREMIETERDYVRSLYYVIENYMQELLREDIPQALRGQRNVIFGNIERIHDFHQQDFLRELECYEHHPLKVGAVFLKHESKFYLYALYNKNKPKSDSLMAEYGSVFFKSKQKELNDKMDLGSYLLKPVQRMGKYALLLQQLMKACANIQKITDQETHDDLEEIKRAEEMVRFQLRHGNDLLAMDSLRDCDVNVKEQGRLLRQNEFLVWEGRGSKKTLRQVFLFEELVLFSKARRFPDRKNLDIYIYKNSIKTSDIGLTAHVGDSATKFEIWFRKRNINTWTLQSMSEEIKIAWTDEISKLLWKQAKRNREIRMAEMSSMGIGSKPCLDIRPSVDQINDRSISFSQLGKTPRFRNSFINTLSDMKSIRRPNSIISLGSSSSSSSSSVGTSSVSSNINGSDKNSVNLKNIQDLDKRSQNHQKNPKSERESGIIADMSLSPEDDPDQLLWPNTTTSLKKSNSVVTTSSISSTNSMSTASSSSSSGPYRMNNHFRFEKQRNLAKSNQTSAALSRNNTSSNSISDAYLNENSISVHL